MQKDDGIQLLKKEHSILLTHGVLNTTIKFLDLEFKKLLEV
jgi:hypothetical protein